MPSGRTHDRITYWCLPFIIAPTAWFTRSPTITVIVTGSFLIGGLMMGPDLDIHSVQYRRWGLLRWIWLPYQIAIKHRSHWSHGPIIGTALRVVYLSVWLALFTIVGVETLNLVWDAQISLINLRDPFRALVRRYAVEWISILVGLELGSVSHAVSDTVGSYLVEQKSRRKNRKNRCKARKSAEK
ncbi:MAG: metal-binding protein [Cyanobacteria bacterium J06560_2]